MEKSPKGVLKFSLVLTLCFFLIEFFGGIYTKSLALLSDSFHMFLDSIALFLTYFTFLISKKPKTPEKTYGYKRAEILAAFFNSITLIILSFYIIYKAILRFFQSVEIKKDVLLIIASLGLIINIISLSLLYKSQKKSLNIKSAYLHILSDFLGSILVLVSSLFIYFTSKVYFDSIASILISILILFSSVKLFNKTLNILMEGTPIAISTEEVSKDLKSIPFVLNVHDLHIWSLNPDFQILTAHISIEKEDKGQEILAKANKILKEKYEINHSTIQIETSYNEKCEQANGNCS